MSIIQSGLTVGIAFLAVAVGAGGGAILEEERLVHRGVQLVQSRSPSLDSLFSAQHALSPDQMGIGFSSGAAHIRRQLDTRLLEVLGADQPLSSLCDVAARRREDALRLPHDIRSHIAWYRVAERLKNRDGGCPMEIDPGEILSFARMRYPSHASLLFLNALHALEHGSRSEGFMLAREFLTVSPRVTRFEEDTLLSHVQGPSDLDMLIPSQVRAVIHWSAILRSRRPDLAAIVGTVIEHRQRLALQALATPDYQKAGAVEQSRDLLSRLEGVAFKDDIRRSIDKRLASLIAEDEPAFHRYLGRRSELVVRDIVVGFRRSDVHPGRTPVSLWNPLASLTLDESYNSLGVYVGGDMPASLIELRGSNEDGISVQTLVVFSSEDNARWIDRTSELSVESFHALGRSVIGIWIPSEGGRYWKVHFASHEKRRKFFNDASEVVRVFGR